VSMTTAAWVHVLHEGRPILRLSELMMLGGLSRAAVRKAAQRLMANGLLLRLGPELYANVLQRPSIEAVACALRPAYVSLESALFAHGLLSQAPLVTTCVTLGRPAQVETGLGEIVYHRIAARMFMGFEAHDDHALALPEKALLDFVYLQRRRGGFALPGELELDMLDLKRLQQLAAGFPGTVRAVVVALLNDDR
jgi:predicted transcriptional regulator of viral defense system